MTEQLPQESVSGNKLVEITPNLKIDLTKLTFLEINNDALEMVVDGAYLYFEPKHYDIKELFNLINLRVAKNG